jgi:hypothetical protein
MNAHVSSILLGVRDMDRPKRFYSIGAKEYKPMTPAARVGS